jgi:hypothetical protein
MVFFAVSYVEYWLTNRSLVARETHTIVQETNIKTDALIGDTAEIKGHTKVIKDDTTAIKDDNAQILSEILKLQARLPQEGQTFASTGITLQRYLDNLSSYAESSYDTLDGNAHLPDDDEVWEDTPEQLEENVADTADSRTVREVELSRVDEEEENPEESHRIETLREDKLREQRTQEAKQQFSTQRHSAPLAAKSIQMVMTLRNLLYLTAGKHTSTV